MFEKGKGFSNPYRHLKACLACGDEQHLISTYTALDTGTFHAARDSIFGKLNQLQKAMHAYIRLILLMLLGLHFIEDDGVRSFFSKYSTSFSTRTVKETMFKIVEIVIEAEINKRKVL